MFILLFLSLYLLGAGTFLYPLFLFLFLYLCFYINFSYHFVGISALSLPSVVGAVGFCSAVGSGSVSSLAAPPPGFIRLPTIPSSVPFHFPASYAAVPPVSSAFPSCALFATSVAPLLPSFYPLPSPVAPPVASVTSLLSSVPHASSSFFPSVPLCEFQNIRFGLFHFRRSLLACSIRVFSDNTTALSYIC